MTWEQVSAEVQAEVVRLAEADQLHPDVRLHRLAYAWAVPVAKGRTWAIWLFIAFSWVAAALSMGASSPERLGEFRARREARLIVALGDPAPAGQR